MSDTTVFGHEPVERDDNALGEFYECRACHCYGETLADFDAQDCV